MPRSRQPPNSGIGYEDRAVCRSSPRSEGCLSAFRRGCDCNHADREFDFDDFVLTASLAQTAKPSVMEQTGGFAFVPHTCRVLGQQLLGCRNRAVIPFSAAVEDAPVRPRKHTAPRRLSPLCGEHSERGIPRPPRGDAQPENGLSRKSARETVKRR